jgi:hypothetical protein
MDSSSGVKFKVVHWFHRITLGLKVQRQLAMKNVTAVVASQKGVEDQKVPLRAGSNRKHEIAGRGNSLTSWDQCVIPSFWTCLGAVCSL